MFLYFISFFNQVTICVTVLLVDDFFLICIRYCNLLIILILVCFIFLFFIFYLFILFYFILHFLPCSLGDARGAISTHYEEITSKRNLKVENKLY